jgi:hypothetical protein
MPWLAVVSHRNTTNERPSVAECDYVFRKLCAYR